VTISRTNVATYLHGQFSALATAIGQISTDGSAAGYGPDIDAMLRKLGKSESELPAATLEDDQRDAAFALAEFFAARRVWRALGDRVNTVTGKNSYSFTDQRANVKAMMEAAADQCALLGYSVDGRVLRRTSFQVY